MIQALNRGTHLHGLNRSGGRIVITATPSSDRPQLGFAESVLDAFVFLTKKYHFHVVKVEPTYVRYESEEVFVNVFHGRASYELGVELGLLSKTGSEQRFSIGEVLQLVAVQDGSAAFSFTAHSAEAVKKFVTTLASQVNAHADAALRGQIAFFNELSGLQQRNSNKLLHEWKLNDVRRDATQAWQARDYAKLVTLYESIRGELTPSEAKKLEYSRKQL